MGKDIFGNELMSLGGVFTADEGIITFPTVNPNSTGIFMIQTITITQAQNTGIIYDLASNYVMLTKGKPAFGQCTFAQIIGPKVEMEDFFNQFGNICNASKNILDVILTRGACEGETQVSKRIALRLYNCFINTMSLASDVGSYQIRQDLTLFFRQMSRIES